MGDLNRTSITSAVSSFVAGRVPALAGRTVDDRTPLLASGLDSLGILELTMFLSEAYGIALEDDDFQIDHFETVGSVVSFVESRRAA